MKAHWIRNLPPFSWSRGYVIFGVTNILISWAAELCMYYAGFVHNPWLGIGVWCFFTGMVWISRPLVIKKVRPCKDCNQI
jgi:hypothetical protein